MKCKNDLSEIYINSLIEERTCRFNWIHQKEISIWSVTLLYITIQSFIANYLLGNSGLIFVSMILVTFFFFIFSQFSSWITTIALVNAYSLDSVYYFG